MSLSKIFYQDQEIGQGSVTTVDNQAADEVIVHLANIQMFDVEFPGPGPFGLVVESQLYGDLRPQNFARLRSGYSYDRLILKGRFIKSMRFVAAEKPADETQERH